MDEDLIPPPMQEVRNPCFRSLFGQGSMGVRRTTKKRCQTVSVKSSPRRFGCSRLRTQRASRPRLRGWRSPRNGRPHVGSKAQSRRLKPLKPPKSQHRRLAGVATGGRGSRALPVPVPVDGAGAAVAKSGAGGGAVVHRFGKVSRRARKSRQRRRRAQKRKAEKRRAQNRALRLRPCGGPSAKPPKASPTGRSPKSVRSRRTWTWSTSDGREKRELEKGKAFQFGFI